MKLDGWTIIHLAATGSNGGVDALVARDDLKSDVNVRPRQNGVARLGDCFPLLGIERRRAHRKEGEQKQKDSKPGPHSHWQGFHQAPLKQ
jgi:hypothetical protein